VAQAVILATQKLQIRRTVVREPQIYKAPSQQMAGHGAYACHLSYTGKLIKEDPGQPGIKQDPVSKKGGGMGMIQVVEHLPHQCEVLSSTPSPKKTTNGQ
jgi:hypothetical protein